MSWASSEIVSVLVFLLPGFVAAAVFYSLTSNPKPNEFGQVVQALVFTMVGQSITWGILYVLEIFMGTSVLLIEGFRIAVSVLSAIFFALIAVYVSNNDIAHGFFRRIGLTRRDSYPSRWYSTFAQNDECYVVLHLKGERRLYGWPEEWPNHPDQGHFKIIESEWLDEDDGSNQSENGAEVFAILVRVEDIEMVEFIKAESDD